MIEPLALVGGVGFEELLPFLVPGFLFFAGLVGYGVLVLVYRWLDGD